MDTLKEATADAAALVGEAVDKLTSALRAQKDSLGGDFSTSLDQNLIIGVGHLDVSGKAKVGDDGVDGSVDAKGSFTLPFVGTPSLDESMRDALDRAKLQPMRGTH